MNHFQTERNFEEGKMKVISEWDPAKEWEKFSSTFEKYLKNYLLYHTWTEFLLIFPSKFIFFHQSETIATDDKNIWSWNHRSSSYFHTFHTFFFLFFLLFIPFYPTSLRSTWFPIEFNRKIIFFLIISNLILQSRNQFIFT